MLLQFTMSEAQANKHPDWETRERTVEVVDTVELVYQTLRDSSTSNVVATFDPEQGLWIAEQDGLAYSDIVIAEPTAAQSELAELLAFADEMCVPEDALDEHVHGLASQAGSEVNNSGLRSQLEYLLRHLGVDEVRRILKRNISETPSA
jgi:hypothetical protein